MRTAKWRRPNEHGNWGSVSAVEWRPIDVCTNVPLLRRHSTSSGAGSMLVPVAKDGSHFGPHLAASGRPYTVGEKDGPHRFEDFHQALAHLKSMKVAKWRRPNAAGNWGLVSAVEWLPLDEV